MKSDSFPKIAEESSGGFRVYQESQYDPMRSSVPMIWVVFDGMPKDFWPGWMTRSTFFSSIWKEYPHLEKVEEKVRGEKLIDCLTLALQIEARQRLTWEGDITVGPLFAGLPSLGSDNDGQFAISWKHVNNGQTFLAVPNAWREAILSMYWKDIQDWIVADFRG